MLHMITLKGQVSEDHCDAQKSIVLTNLNDLAFPVMKPFIYITLNSYI